MSLPLVAPNRTRWNRPGRTSFVGLLALSVLVLCAVSARAQTAPSAPPLASSNPLVQQSAPSSDQDAGVLAFLKQIEIAGFVDVYYGYNFDKPDTRQAQLRNFDVQHNSFTLSLAELSLEKKPVADSRGGFRLDLDYGSTTGIVNASEPGDRTLLQNIGQAYASYLAPMGRGVQFDVGKFATPMGNEVIKTKDNWNYSRSFLFTLAEPYYHMGVRATYAVNDRVTLSGHLVNGWNDVVDNNTGKTFGVQATLKPSAALTVAGSYMAGPEQANDHDDWRHLFDVVVSYAATPAVTVAGNYDYGRDRVEGSAVSWQGVAAYLRYQPAGWFALSPRVEYYRDGDGFTTGNVQSLKEVTLTAEVKGNGGLVARVEYRRDVSDVPVFVRSGNRVTDRQGTLTIGALYVFSSK